MVPVDRRGEPAELEVERGVVGLHGRRDLGAEEPRLEAAEAADGAEALALVGGRLDRGGPVGLDAERRGLDREALVAGREDHGNARDLVEALLEQRARLLRRQAADVDARDLDAVGDPGGRAREREPEQRGENREQRSETRTQRAITLPSAQAPCRRERMSLRPARAAV